MQIEGDLDDSTLDTIIVDVPFAPISLANQDTQNEDSANQEAQGSRDSCSDKEHIQLLTPATTNAPPSTTTLTNGQNSPIEEETHGPGWRNNEISSFLDKSNILPRSRRNAHAVAV